MVRLLGWLVTGVDVALTISGACVVIDQAYRRRMLRRAVLLLAPSPMASTRPPTMLVSHGPFLSDPEL